MVREQSLTTHALRVGFYALLQVLESGMRLAMLRHLITRRQAGLPAAVASHGQERVRPDARLRAVFFATSYGWILCIAIPVLAAPALPPPAPEPPSAPAPPASPASAMTR